MKASKKVIRAMARTYEPKKGWGGKAEYGKAAKTVLKKSIRWKKKP